jgi:2-amino-4-hydroxy-6-hydroxymethyldihydropteridine diphosphokinase
LTTKGSKVVIGLGSNEGDRLANLRAAVKRLARVGTLLRASPVYETAPVGPPQPDYLNAAVLLAYQGEPLDLLALLQGIESALGRKREPSRERWGPRPIDLDILWIEGLAMESDVLVVPHPGLTERAFALRPLVDVVPDAIDPMSLLPYARLFDEEAARMRPTGLDLMGPS